MWISFDNNEKPRKIKGVLEHIKIEIDPSPCFASQINNTPHDIIVDLPSFENDVIKCQHFSLSEKLGAGPHGSMIKFRKKTQEKNSKKSSWN